MSADYHRNTPQFPTQPVDTIASSSSPPTRTATPLVSQTSKRPPPVDKAPDAAPKGPNILAQGKATRAPASHAAALGFVPHATSPCKGPQKNPAGSKNRRGLPGGQSRDSLLIDSNLCSSSNNQQLMTVC